MTLVCPVTTTSNGFPLHVKLPESLDERYGYVVLEQVRAYDLDMRNAEVVAHLDASGLFMRNVTNALKSFL